MFNPEIDFEALLQDPSFRKALSELCGVDLTTNHITPMQAYFLINDATFEQKEFIASIMPKTL
jgi:hypothetical protein